VSFATGSDVAAAVALAKESEVVIAVVGNHPTCNAGWNVCPLPSDGKEAIDRKSIDLEQEQLVQQLYAANPHTVVVLNASFPYAVNWTQAHIPAVLEMTHNSEEEGTGLADVLFGDYNPAGRLTQTWPVSMAELPPMMDYDLTHGRTYLYSKEKPLYAFGYGLSYTSFKYSNLKVSANSLREGGALQITADIANAGGRNGDEVVQLYVRHLGSKVARPLEELKGFTRVSIPAGATKSVSFSLPASSLAYWNTASHAFEVEHDKVELLVGAASDDIRLRDTITVEK
jgi:beta-glucosidase